MNISTCPYLGMQDDPETRVSFPSQANFCHHLKNPRHIDLDYQRAFCLTGQHIHCEIFPEGRYTRLPAGARLVASDRRLTRRPWFLIILILVILLVVVGIGLFQFAPDLLPFSFQMPSQGRETLPASPVADRTSATLPSLTATPDYFTPTAYLTSTSVPPGIDTNPAAVTTFVPLGLETPIGVEPILMIHRVLPGESLDLIAAHFDTTIDAVRGINYTLPSPLLVDFPIIVPVGAYETAGLPQFEAYQVSAAGITVEQLAQGLGLDAAELRKYNLLPEGAQLVNGQWLLLPRSPY